jgi:hypothetical protein
MANVYEKHDFLADSNLRAFKATNLPKFYAIEAIFSSMHSECDSPGSYGRLQ